MEKLTQQRLKTLLHYNPKTGIFTWKIFHGNTKAGNIAGTLHSNGYIYIGIDGNKYRANRLTYLYILGYFPEHQIYYINKIRDDNKWLNLYEKYWISS